MSFFTDIPLIADGITTLDANSINPSLEALKANTIDLDNRLNNLSGSAGLIYSDNAFSDTVVNHEDPIGLLLAWDSVNHVYIPASASWAEDKAADNGRLIPADGAYVTGVLISAIDDNGYGTILAYGWTTDKAVIGALTSDKFITGTYYLGTDGKAVPKTDGMAMDLPVYCFTYTSTGKLVFNPRVPERYGHNHGKYILTGFTANSVGGATCTPDDGSALSSVLKSYPAACQLFKNGTMLASDDWSIVDRSIRLSFMPLADDEVVLFAITPTVGYEPLVHSVSVDSGCKLLEATNSNGNVVLNFKTEPVSSNVSSGNAVVAVDGQGYSVGPVVQQLYAGVGASISEAVDAEGKVIPGSLVVSANNGIYDQRDLQVCNLDGVLFGVDSTKIGYRFPAGVTSSLYGTVRLPHFEGNTKYTAVLSLIVEGSAEGYPAGLTAYITPIADQPRKPSTEVVIDFSNLSNISGVDHIISTDIDGLLVSSDCLLHCRISCDTPATALTILGVSVSLKVEQ
jgi:hypothetical protein